jgi:hypothetical protein
MTSFKRITFFATNLISDFPVITGKSNKSIHFYSFIFNPDMGTHTTIHVSPLNRNGSNVAIDGVRIGNRIYLNSCNSSLQVRVILSFFYTLHKSL